MIPGNILHEEGSVTLSEGRRAITHSVPNTGNRHTPCQIATDRPLIRPDHVVCDILTRTGATVTRAEERFVPGSGVSGRGPAHGHVLCHDPYHDPNADMPHRHADL